MFQTTHLEDWEALVKKQLKTDDIYSILLKENLEGIVVRPYLDVVSRPLKNLPKIEESTQLVANYREDLEEKVFAFILKEQVEHLESKALYIASKELAGQVLASEENKYYSLVDPFDEVSANLDQQLSQELLAKNFDRNLAVDLSLHQNAGASLVQQLGIAIAKTKELVEEFGPEILSKITLRIAVGGNYFFEIAKIRALKLLYNQLSKEYKLDEVPYIFAETSLRNKSKFDEENNLIRSTLELSAAMIGGADAVFANDYKLENANELSEEIAFKQMIVLAYESIINVFEDAANGSYIVEDLTQQLTSKAWKYFLEIENSGGYLENLKNGKLQAEIFQQATKEQQWVMDGKIKLIGVNLYPKMEVKKTMEELYKNGEIKPVRWAEMYE